MVENLIKNKHTAMLEHGTVYLLLQIEDVVGNSTNEYGIAQKYASNKYSFCNWSDTRAYITTNYRVIIENGWLDDLQYQYEPTEFHEKRISVRFTCDIGVSREFNRHRVDSIAEQSTRYCNFSKEQFGNEITCIQPNWVEDHEINQIDSFQRMLTEILNGTAEKTWNAVDYWLFSLYSSEFSYIGCINNGWKAQQARDCLTLSTKTELIHTATISDWKHFFGLRDDSAAHPSARELAQPLHEEFKLRNFI